MDRLDGELAVGQDQVYGAARFRPDQALRGMVGGFLRTATGGNSRVKPFFLGGPGFGRAELSTKPLVAGLTLFPVEIIFTGKRRNR